MLDTNTKKRIDDCRDILVGKLPDPKAQIDQITLALIYKFMDDMDQQSKSFGGVSSFFVNDFEKYSWSNIMSAHMSANDMLKLYSKGIEKMSLNQTIQPLFRSIFKDAYLPYRDPETLKMFLKKINEFSYDHSEVLGDAFEYLLSVMGSQGDAGQFRTPRHIIDFMVDIISPKKDETILDPSCGTSGFLISAYKKVLSDNTKDRPGDLLSSMEKKRLLGNVSGYDISPDMIRLSLANLFLHGFNEENLKIFEYDTLTSLDRWNEYYDVVLANPPFMTPKGGIRPHNRFTIKSNRAEVLFVDYIIEHLTPKGRAAIIVPEGVIFKKDQAYKNLRKSLIDTSLIGVISLPSGVFNPYSPVKTSILFLDKELSQKTNKIFFGKVNNDGYDLGSQRRIIDKNDLPSIKTSILQHFDNISKNLDIENPNLQYLPKKTLIDSADFGLNYNRYIDDVNTSVYDLISLDELIDYEQPNKYIVKSENYSDEYSTPVLTAGKSFIKGYTNESDNVYSDFPVIIFDDFTTSSRYVDFPFKVKSSAMKILKCKEGVTADIKFIYYAIKGIKVDSEEHRRYWISIFSKKKIPLPQLEFQKEIVKELEQYEKIINGAKEVINNYKPHIEIDDSWVQIELGRFCEIRSGGTPSKKENSYWENGTIPWVGSTVCKNNFINNVETYITKKGLSESSAKIFPIDTILIALVGATIGKTAYLNTETSTNQNIAGVIVKDNSNPKFIFYSIQMLYSKFIKLGQGKYGMANLSFIKSLEIKIPPVEIQDQIVEKLDSERMIIEGNKKLIKIYTKKIEDRINKIWES